MKALFLTSCLLLFFSLSSSSQPMTQTNQGVLKVFVGGYLIIAATTMQFHNEQFYRAEVWGSHKPEMLLDVASGASIVFGGWLLAWGIEEIQRDKKIKVAQTENGVGLVVKF